MERGNTFDPSSEEGDKNVNNSETTANLDQNENRPAPAQQLINLLLPAVFRYS